MYLTSFPSKRRGDLYKAEYSGWYSVQDETFLPEGQVGFDVAPRQIKEEFNFCSSSDNVTSIRLKSEMACTTR